MNKIRVVLFDLGNVLVNLGDSQRFAEIFQIDATKESDMWDKWLRSPSVKAFDKGQISLEAFASSLLKEVGSQQPIEDFITTFTDWPIGLFDGAHELLAKIPASYHRAVLSNTNDAHWGRILDEMKLSGCFHTYFASHQMGMVKPDEDIFDRVINELNVAPDSILFLDDNVLNVKSARKLGIVAEQVKGIECAEKILYNYNVIS